ncbi:uncharacterized protein Sptz [Panulirus ornatus]|uniref:uncharacterized protein Sptz n=1 Tax=Panulirus ornatus TaxID=150431 RepID=UPI003A8AB449
MGSTNVNCGPLLRYLFQNEDKIYKELDTYFHQDGSLITDRLSLSSEAYISLKEKLLTCPQEAACILHELEVTSRQVKTRKDTQQDTLSSVERSSSHRECQISGIPKDLSQQNRIFIECLDHCIRRVENLDEKLHKEREEYSEVLKRQQRTYLPRSSSLGIRQGTLESKEALKLKERTVATNMEKLRNETLFYTIFSLTGDMGIAAMIELLPRILRLCYEKKLLVASKIYFSLMSSSGDCLRLYCERERDYLLTKFHTKKVEHIEGTLFVDPLDVREFFHICAKSLKHLLEILYEVIISNPTVSLMEIEVHEESCWLIPFWPLVFIHTMSVSPDKIADPTNVALVWEKHSVVVDPLLMKVCTDLSQDMKLVAWCLAHNSRIKPLPLLQLIRDHSPMYVLHKSLPLHTLVPTEVLQLLKEHCMVRDKSGDLSSYCKSTYMAFCMLSKVFEVIGAGMQLDNIVAGWQARGKLYSGKRLGFVGNDSFQDRESPASFYKQNISEKLKAVQSMLNDLHPLEYRLEVMENIYSLLFVKHSDMSDEGQSESGEEEDELEQSFISQQTDESVASTSHTATPQRPRSPQKSSNPASFSASEKTEDSKMYKVLNFSDYVVISERSCEKENIPSQSSDVSSVSDEGPSKSSSTEGSEKNLQHASDAVANVKLYDSSSSSAVTEQLHMEAYPQLSHSGPTSNQSSSCAMSGKRTGSSLSELPRTGYLINTLVAWDILILLRDSLLAFSADSYKKISQTSLHEENSLRQYFQNRISYLSRSVTEGLWRLQVMSPRSHTFASLDVFDIYLNGTLLSNTADCLVYENFSGLESAVSRSSSYGEAGSMQGGKKRPAKDYEPMEAVSSSECIGVINFLFASPSSLITLALANGNVDRIEQIFQMFKVPDTLEKREALLAVRLNELRPKLSVTNHKSRRVKEAKAIQTSSNSRDMLQNIGLLAREGSAQIGSTNLIHDLVTSLPPPVPKGIPEAALENGCPLMASFLTPKALVLTDLALTVDVSETTATYLIEQALQRQTTHDTTYKHVRLMSSIQGYIPVLQQMGSICSTIIEMRNPQDSDSGGIVGKDITENTLLHCFDQPATPFSLFLSSLPLRDADVRNYINGLSRVLGSICAAEEALLSDTAREDQEHLDVSIHSQKNQIHFSYKRLLHVMSEEAPHLYPSSFREKSDTKLGAFLRSFYHYLQLLSAMVTHHTNKRFLENMKSYFCLLTQRPVHILGSLMFKEGVDPVRLEPLAARMRLNLTAMILQYCCPKFTIPREKLCGTVCPSVRDKANMLGFMVLQKQVIMNAGDMLCKVGVFGEVVVRDILMTLLSGLREAIQPVAVSSKTNLKAVILNDATAPNTLSSVDVLMALKDTADLAAVDFKKMVPGNEAVVFFINLANLMYIHAGVLNHILYPGAKHASMSRGIFSKYQLERIMAMKRLGYVVGQLGFLSLYDILYNILSLHNPLSSILVQNDGEHKITICDSNLICRGILPSRREELLQVSELLVCPSRMSFCITQGTPVSPRVQVIHADRMEEQIDVGVQEHLRLFLLTQDSRKLKPDLDVKHSDNLGDGSSRCSILTTRTILDYLALHSENFVVGIQSLRKTSPEDLASTLQRVESDLLKSRQLEVIVLDRNEEKGIALEYLEAFADENSVFVTVNEPKASSIHDTPVDLPWLPVKVPHTVLTHLRKQCPLLGFIVQAFHSTSEMNKKSGQAWMDAAADTWLNILYPPSMGIKPPVEETKVFQAIRNLFLIDRHKALARIYEGNKVASALSYDPNVYSIWNLADDLLGSGAITKEYFSSLPHHVADLVIVLQALPTYTVENYPDLILLLDHLLVFLVQSMDSAADPAPWMYAHQISDSDMRFALVMEIHREWPVSAAIDLLSLVAHDPKLPCHQQDLARERAEQIKVYEKILMLGNQSYKSWQKVEHISTERPAELLQYLVQKKQFRLSVQWADYHRGSAELRRLVDQSYLMDVLDKTTPDYDTAIEALRTLDTRDLAMITQELLQKLSSIPTRRFLIEVFLNNLFSEEMNTECNQNDEHKMNSKEDGTIGQGSSAEGHFSYGVQLNVATLQQEVMGLILVEDVAPPASDRFQLSHLASAPHLIVEQWLMNIRLEAIEKTVKVLGQHLDKVDLKMPLSVRTLDLRITSSDTPVQTREPHGLSWDVFNWLLEVYAAKALDTSGVQLALKPQPISEKSPRKFVMPPQPPERHEWVPDGEVRKCPVCEVAIFSMFCRRHHCRRCGRVVCSSCSQHKNIVQGYGNLLVRVCFDCNQQIKELNLQDYIQVRPLGDGTYDTVSQNSDTHSTRGGTSWTSDTEGGWYLSTDTHHNDMIRQEFCYDYAPSLSLCLAILAQHQDHRRAAVCIVNFCHHLFSLIISSLKLPSPEANHSFVLSMIQTLLTSAKVRFGNVGEHQGIGFCEYYTHWVDLLSLLLKANCGHIIPFEVLQNMLVIGNLHQKSLMGEKDVQTYLEKQMQQEFFYMRRLRDTLVKKQMWELALDVSTKAGLETNGVWGAWAMASLKAGDFPGARERFSRVLERPLDKNRACKSSLLPEVIKYLESNPFQINQQVMDQAERARSSIVLSDQARLPPSQSLVVLHTLQNLENIAQGNMTCNIHRQLSFDQRSKTVNAPRIESVFQIESRYYLTLYGNHSMTIQYFMRNKQLQECIEYLHAEDVNLEIFIEEILIPCLRCGQLDCLMKYLYASESRMDKWAKLMFGSCRWLERHGWWNCLLTVQEAVGDRMRASMTLLRMYKEDVKSYEELSNRSELITLALTHLQTYLDSQALHRSTTRRNNLILGMRPWHVNQSIDTLALQAEATKFISSNDLRENISSFLQSLYEMQLLQNGCIPTLLENDDERLAVAVLVVCVANVLADGLNLAYRIVERNNLHVEKLLSVCCQLLVNRDRLECISPLVKGIQEWEVLTVEAVDIALRPAIQTVAANNQNTFLDALVKLLSSDKAKMEAFISCGRLKSAYLVAVHHGCHEDVERVQEVALIKGQVHVATMCSKWLTNYHSCINAS